MAKKKKKRNRKKRTQSSVSVLTVKELEEKGRAFLASGSFQQAALCFKELLKKEEGEEALQLLGEANRGRLNRLLEKGQLKEALVLLDAMVRGSGASGLESLHIQLLLRTGKFTAAVSLYNRHRSEMDGNNGARLDALFGAYLLSGDMQNIEGLPEDSAILQHLHPTAKALAAYCRRDNAGAESAMKEIAFRSPYRDVRLLIKGLMLLEENHDEARRFLDKIDSASPYRRFVELYGLRFSPASTILSYLREASSAQRKTIETVLALDRKQISVLRGLAESVNNPRRLLRVLTASGNCLPDAVKKSLIQRVLPHCGPESMTYLQRSRQFSEIEMLRLVALAAQVDDEPVTAVEFWDDYLELIEQFKLDNPLMLALILRHQVKLMQRGRSYFYPAEMLGKLEKSLEYDPQDKETWLRVFKIASYEAGNKHYQLVNQAAEVFPDDADILLKMIEAAANRGAFKKASRFADRLLAIDPINTRAKELLVEARLAHGRKLAGQKKAELARREFAAAEATIRSGRYQGRHLICLGILSLLQEREEEGLALIEQGRRKGVSPLASLVLTAVEARLMGITASWIRTFDKEVQQAAANQAPREEILRIAGWIKTFTGRHWLALLACCKALPKLFNQASAMEWSREEGLLVCRSLLRAELFRVLEKLAQALLKKWPAHPEMEFFQIKAKAELGRKEVDDKERKRLIEILDAALDGEDYELANQVEDLLDDLQFRSDSAWDFAADDDFFPEEEELFEPLFKLPPQTPRKKKKKKPSKPPARQLNLFDLDT